MYRVFFVFFVFFNLGCFAQQIQVLFTSALISHKFEERKSDYLKSLRKLRSFNLEPWIIEATNIESSFFDNFSDRVLYPKTNNLLLKNKGVNEVLSLKASLEKLPFQDDDIVIKLTGRYLFKNSSFVDVVKANIKQYDAFVLYGNHFVSDNHVFTGCFAMKWEFFKKFISEWDLEDAEKRMIPVEQAVSEFITNNNIKTFELKKLNLLAKVFFSGEDGIPIMEF